MIRRLAWTDAWIASVACVPLWIAPGAAAQPIAAAFLAKGLALLLVVLPGLACAPRAARVPLRHAALLLAVATAYAIAAIANPPDRTVEAIDALARVALPLVALAIAAGAASPRSIFLALVVCASVLAALVILESLGVPVSSEAQARPAVLLLHRNNVAFHLAAALPLTVAALAHGGSRRARSVAGAAVVLLVVAIVVARSRGAWLAAGCGLVPLAFVVERRILARLVAASAVVALALGAWSARAGLEPLSERVRGAFDPEGEAAWFERLAIYGHAIDRIAERPLTGWGAGDFATRHARFLDGRPADHPHDDLLTAAYEAGVPAALALALVLAAVPIHATRRARRSRSPLLAGFAGSLVAWAVLGLLNSPLSLAPSAAWFWLTVGAALATSRQEDPR